MNLNRMKWIGPIFPALFIGVFEFARHHFLHIISMNSGNVLVAVLTGLLFFMYFHVVFAWIQTLNAKLQQEKEELVIMKERDRIADELHDSIAQALFFMNIKAIEIDSALRQGKQPLAAIMELQEAIKFTDTDIRQHIFDLHRMRQENIDLLDSIRKLAAAFQEQSGIKVDLDLQGNFHTELNQQKKSHLIRILQEVLCNIRKHAKAEHVQVSLRESENKYNLMIKDDGEGFAADNLKGGKSSFGLKIMEERSSAIGAQFNLESFPGRGTLVSISMNLH